MISSILLGSVADKIFTSIQSPDNKPLEKITVITTSEHPPFEYKDQEKLKGFDIDLALLLGEKLGASIEFYQTASHSVLSTLQRMEKSQEAFAISSLSLTEERMRKFDFSCAYHSHNLLALFNKRKSFAGKFTLNNKRVAFLGCSSIEEWVKDHAPSACLMSTPSNKAAIELLEEGTTDFVVLDNIQGKRIAQEKRNLGCYILAGSEEHYAIATKKGSKLCERINNVLQDCHAQIEIKELRTKWLFA